MSHFASRRRYSWFFVVLIAILLISCNGDAGEEATAQVLLEQIVSTNTPIPTEPPTDTPLPPTDTPTPLPTDTPVPPTETPTPASSLIVEDPLEDSYNCDTQAAVTDPEVDIASISAIEQEDSLLMQVFLNNPLVNDYSFAILLTLVSGDDLNYYVWETHETDLRIGEIDSQTGELIAGSGAGLQIDHDQTVGQVTFTIPVSYTAVVSATVPITATVMLSGTDAPLDQFYISSFHSPQEGEARNCDTAGPYEYR